MIDILSLSKSQKQLVLVEQNVSERTPLHFMPRQITCSAVQGGEVEGG